jgi:hypothetical protein
MNFCQIRLVHHTWTFDLSGTVPSNLIPIYTYRSLCRSAAVNLVTTLPLSDALTESALTSTPLNFRT